jgi:hypothetical protein
MSELSEKIIGEAEQIAKENNHVFSSVHVLSALLKNEYVERIIINSSGDYKNLRKQVEEIIDIGDKTKNVSNNSKSKAEKLFRDLSNNNDNVPNLLLRIIRLKDNQIQNLLYQNNVIYKDVETYILREDGEDSNSENSDIVAWDMLEVAASYKNPGLIIAENGLFDIAASSANFDLLKDRIESAYVAIDNLIVRCERGNMQHADLAAFAKEYKDELSRLSIEASGISWYSTARKIENYRSNYVAVSKEDPGEYPRLDPGFSATIDNVVLATGIIARLFPEIARCQDDFETYAGRQIGVRISERNLLDSALSDLAASQEVMTPRAGVVTRKIADLSTGKSPEDSPEVARTVATKAGFVRSFIAAMAGEILRVGRSQMKLLGDNVKTKITYDITKELAKYLMIDGYTQAVSLIGKLRITLGQLAESWPAMFDFIPAVLRLLGF